MTPLFMMLLTFAAHSAPAAGPPPAPAPWKTFAECSAAYYADAQLPDPIRTRPLKDDLLAHGRLYAVQATTLRDAEWGKGHDRARAYTKSYILERTRLLAFRTRPEIRAVIGGCPKL